MTHEHEPKTSHVFDRIREWMHARREERELNALPAELLSEIAHDVGLSVYELTHVATRNPGASTLMPRRLDMMGIDPEYVRATKPAVYRDLERVCGRCQNWQLCDRDLAEGNVDDGQCSYCGNAATIDALAVGGRRHADNARRIKG
jgi:uncharacterized protein YjiS (DUF1127 family)